MLLNNICVVYFEINIIILDWEMIWSQLINIWEARVRIPSEPLFFFKAYWKSSNGENMSQPGSDQWKKKGKSLEYCSKCQDQLISEINNEGLMSKLQNMGRRDKTTKDMV